MIFAKDLQMFRQLIDSTGQQCDLDVGTPGIFLMKPKCTQIDVIACCHNLKNREHRGLLQTSKRFYAPFPINTRSSANSPNVLVINFSPRVLILISMPSFSSRCSTNSTNSALVCIKFPASIGQILS